MATSPISLILKQQRNLHEMTPEQVIARLSEQGFTISTKALYAYESGANLPKVPVFLALCDIYEIRDIMGSFGYTSIPLCTEETEWDPDQYEDFFKVTLYEKIYLLKMWGIPSFEKYKTLMTQPAQLALSNNEIELIRMYRDLDSTGKATASVLLKGLFDIHPGEKASSAPKEA